MYSGLFDLPWWGGALVALALTHVTIAAVTIFLHRHQAHRALELHPLPSHFFRLWLWLTTGMVTREWAAIHRKHHARCETPDDPHSPQVLGIHRVLWGGVILYKRESSNQETLRRYGQGTPDDWLERHLYAARPSLGISLMALVDAALFGVLPGLAIWAVQMVWIPFWAAGVINGIGHFWGYRNYDCADASRNILPWGILIGGEELHNNHHAFGTSARLSSKWYEFDIGWLYIRVLELLRLARVKRLAPRLRLTAARSAIDLETLHAVITHRYDVMARYLKSLRAIYREERRRLGAANAAPAERTRFRDIRRWLAHESEKLPAPARAKLDSVLVRHPRLATVYAMRRELCALWERSNATREQLLTELQDWIARAEASGIAQLQEFSLRLRRYAV